MTGIISSQIALQSFPVYKIPISYGYGGFIGTDFIWQKPEGLLQVVKDFPNLHLNLNHAGFPYVLQTLHIAYRNRNLFLSPDLYFGLVIGNKSLRSITVCFAEARHHRRYHHAIF